jgi:hypothetical protein
MDAGKQAAEHFPLFSPRMLRQKYGTQAARLSFSSAQRAPSGRKRRKLCINLYIICSGAKLCTRAPSLLWKNLYTCTKRASGNFFSLLRGRDLFKRYTYLAPARSFFSFSSRSKHIVPPQGEDFPLALKQIYHMRLPFVICLFACCSFAVLL